MARKNARVIFQRQTAVEKRRAPGGRAQPNSYLVAVFLAITCTISLCVSADDGLSVPTGQAQQKGFNSEPPYGATPQADLRQTKFWKVKPVDTVPSTRWKFVIPSRLQGHSIVLFQDILYVKTPNQIFAIDATAGKVLWPYPVYAENDPNLKIRTSPCIVSNMAYFSVSIEPGLSAMHHDFNVDYSVDHYVYALNLHNRTLLWKFKSIGPVENSPIIANGIAYFCSDYPAVAPAGVGYGQFVWLYAVNALTGDLLWRFNLVHSLGGYSPAVCDGRVYITYGKQVCSLDAKTGNKLWSCATENVKTPPIVLGDTVYIVEQGKDLLALDAKSGKEQWRMDRAVFDLACDGNTLYCAEYDKNAAGSVWRVVAVSRDNQKEIWQIRIPASPATEIKCVQIAGHMLFCVVDAWDKAVGSNEYLLAIDTRDRKIKWSFSGRGKKLSALQCAFGDGVVYLADCHENALYALQ